MREIVGEIMVNLEDRLLRKVEKPTRYTGGELNSVVKEKEGINIRFAFCFPDVYEVRYVSFRNENTIWNAK